MNFVPTPESITALTALEKADSEPCAQMRANPPCGLLSNDEGIPAERFVQSSILSELSG